MAWIRTPAEAGIEQIVKNLCVQLFLRESKS
jgi:hypothetical protein